MTVRRCLLPLAAFIAVAALVAVGCAVKAPPINRWSLGGSAASAAPVWDASGPALGLAAVTSVPEIRTTSLTWRTDGGRRLERHPTEQWADYPDHLVESLLLARLASSGHYSLVRPTPPARGTDAVLECELTDFTEWDGPGTGEARVALTCLLETGDAVAPRPLAVEGRVATPRATAAGMVEALAAAARQAVDALADDVAAALTD